MSRHAELDLRPARLDVTLYVDQAAELVLVFPDAVAGRTFAGSVSLGSESADASVTVAGEDRVRLSWAAEALEPFARREAWLVLAETVAGVARPLAAGVLRVQRAAGGPSSPAEVTVTYGDATVDLQVVPGVLGDALAYTDEQVAAEAAVRGAADDALSETLADKADLVGGVVPDDQLPADLARTSDLAGFLAVAENLADLSDAAEARANLALGSAAVADVGDFDAAGDAASAVSTHVGATDPHGDRAYADGVVATRLDAEANLADLDDVSESRANLGLGTAALADTGDFDAAGDATAAVGAHVVASDPHGDRAYADGLDMAMDGRVSGLEGALTDKADLVDGTVPDEQIPADIARQSDVSTAVAGLLVAADNLSDLASVSAARSNLGLGTAAVEDADAFDTAGTASSAVGAHTVASDPHGDRAYTDAEVATRLAKADNLSDLASASTARTNLGLGSAATQDSSAFDSSGTALALARLLAPMSPVTGCWFSPSGATLSTVLPGNGVMYLVPVVTPWPITYDALGVEVTIVGSTGSLVRFGVYSDNNGQPGSLVLDAGTVSSETLGVVSVAASGTLAPGRHWLAIAQQGNPGTRATYRTVSALAGNFMARPDGQGIVSGRYVVGVTGAFPSTPTPQPPDAAVFLRVMARIA